MFWTIIEYYLAISGITCVGLILCLIFSNANMNNSNIDI